MHKTTPHHDACPAAPRCTCSAQYLCCGAADHGVHVAQVAELTGHEGSLNDLQRQAGDSPASLLQSRWDAGGVCPAAKPHACTLVHMDRHPHRPPST
eukprot:364712-Chlamydomonas_euryale.AAC.7